MIQNAESNELNGTAVVQDFGIEMNATVFDMLVSKVYTDKIMAVIREWSTNAVDACIDAKLPIKFRAHLPTNIEPYFSVRDYGTGLSNEDVLGLYSTLGASTKRESNDYNGTFGIGRGVGLAYAKRFQVDSYFNGKKISYLITMDSGIPKMVSLGTSITDEPNGLCLLINVEHTDIREFMRKAVDVYQFFDTRPETNIKLEYKEVDTILSGDSWYIEGTKLYSRYSNTPLLIMGNVAYQVDTDSVAQELKSLCHISLRVKVPLGSVSITPGRESLSMDKKTVSYVNEILKGVISTIQSSVDSKISTYDTGWKKACEFNKIVANLPRYIRQLINTTFDIPDNLLVQSSYSSRQVVLSKVPVDSPIVCTYVDEVSKVGRNINGFIGIRASKNVVVMISDIATGHTKAAKHYLSTIQGTARGKAVVLVRMKNFQKSNTEEVIKELEKFVKGFGDPGYVLASTYKTKPTKGASKVSNFAPLLLYANFRGDRSICKGKDISYYTSKKLAYVEMSRYDVVGDPDEVFSYVTLFKIYEAQNPEGEKYKVIGVPKSHIGKIKGDKRFIPLKDAVTEILPKVSVIDFSKLHEMYKVFKYFSDTDIITVAEHILDKELAHDLKKVIAFKEKWKDHVHYTIGDIGKYIEVSVKSPKTYKNFSKLLEMYPIAPHITSFHTNDGKVKSIIRYIDLEYTYKKYNSKTKEL